MILPDCNIGPMVQQELFNFKMTATTSVMKRRPSCITFPIDIDSVIVDDVLLTSSILPYVRG